MNKSCLPVVLLSLLSGTADASHPPPPPLAACTDGAFSVYVILNDGRHGGGVFIWGGVRFDGPDFVEILARVDDLVLVDSGPNVIWRGDGFHLRIKTSREFEGTSLFPAKFNGRDDYGNPILIDNLVCSLWWP